MKLGKKLRFLCFLCAFALLPYHRWIINPVSKIWAPFFKAPPLVIINEAAEDSTVSKESEREVIIANASGPTNNTNTREQIFDYIQEFLNLSLTQKADSESEPQTPIVNNFNTYVTTGSRGSSSQGLADTMGRATTNLQGNIDTINSNSVFNTSVLSVDTTNTRVGIGTSSPTDTLSVNGPVYLAQISAPSNTTNRLYNSSGDLYWAGSVIGGATTGQWTTDGTHAWRTSGNIGMGTSSPYRKLSVSGDAVFTGGDVLASTFTATSSITTPSLTLSSVAINSLVSTNASGIVVATSVPTFGYFNATSTSATSTISGGLAIVTSGFVYDYSTGNIGMGTASPGSRLVVKGVGATSASSALNVTNSADTSMLYVRNDGNVGIGTTGPLHPLEVAGAFGTGTEGIAIYNTSAKGGGNTSSLLFKAVNGFSSGATLGYVQTINTHSTGDALDSALTFGTAKGAVAATEKMRIDMNGNVGIGTTSPSYKLDVNGGTGIAIRIAGGGDLQIDAQVSGSSAVLYNNTGILTSSVGMNFPSFGTASGRNSIDYVTGTGYGAPGAWNTNSNGDKLVFYRNGIDSESVIGMGGTSNMWIKSMGAANVNMLELWGSTQNSGSPTQLVTFKNTGAVGIGTTSPGQKLSVNGSVGLPALANDSTGYYVCLNTTTGVLATSTTACGASSLKFKENILDLGYGLEEILKLRAVSFDYKEEYVKNGKRQIGFVAEEVESLIPEVVAKDDRGEIQGLDYPKFVSVLVKAIQELNTKVDMLSEGLKNGLTAVKNLVLDSLSAEIVYTKELNADQINVKNINIGGDICVNNTCITKDLFEQMILRSGVGAVQMSSGAVPPPSPDSAKAPTGEEGGGESDTATSTEETASSTPKITIEENSEPPSPSQGEGVGDEVDAENQTTGLDTSQNSTPQ